MRRTDNESFGAEMLTTNPLDVAIEWIKSKLTPGDVFSNDELETWALENDFVKKEEQP